MNTKAANTAPKAASATSVTSNKILQRQCACGNHTASGGECSSCASKKLQRKLSIGSTNDPMELEADRVADQVMAYQPAHSFSNTSAPKIQRRAEHSSEKTGEVPASVEHVLARSGSPLPTSVRKDMEQRFGQDFSQVRMHTGSTAEQSATDVNANAYTVGNNIVFNRGQFSPETSRGKHLLAHELTHVVQQSNTSGLTKIQRDETAEDLKPRDESLGLFEGGAIKVLAETGSVGNPAIKPILEGGATGFYTEIRHQVNEGNGQKFFDRWKNLLTSPSDMIAYGKGYFWGILKGLWSPIQGIIDIAVLGWKLQQWQLNTMVNVIKNIDEIITMQGSLGDRFAKLGSKVKAFFSNVGANALEFIDKIIGAISGSVFELAKSGGRKAGQAIFKFLEKPWGEIGEGIGTVVGTVLVEVGLAFASGGIGNALTKVGQALDKVAPTLMKGVRFIASEVGVIIKELHALVESIKTMLAKAGRSLLKGLEELIGEIGGIFDDLIAMLKKIFTGAEEAAAKIHVDVPLPVKPSAPQVPSLPKAPHIETPKSGAKLPKEPHVDAGAAKKTSPSIKPNEPPLIKSQSEAVKFVEEHPPQKITGEPGQRKAKVGDGHEVVELPGGGCELHSPPPHLKVPCPKGMGIKKTETLDEFKKRGGEVKYPEVPENKKMPKKLESESIAVKEPKPPEGFEDLDVPSRTEKQAGVRVGEDHHVLTRYRQENKKMFEKIGFDVDDDFNLIKDFKEHGEMRGWQKWDPNKKKFIFQQKGHHPDYNDWAIKQVRDSVKGLRGKARQQAFHAAVKRVAIVVEKHPEILAYGPDIFSKAAIARR